MEREVYALSCQEDRLIPTVSGGTDRSASSDQEIWVLEHCGAGAAPALLGEPLQNLKCNRTEVLSLSAPPLFAHPLHPRL